MPQQLERVVRARDTMRLLGYSQNRPELQAVHAKFHGLIEPVIAGRTHEWILAMAEQPNPLAVCMEAIGKAYGELVDNYPTAAKETEDNKRQLDPGDASS